MSVCLSVCPLAYLKNRVSILHEVFRSLVSLLRSGVARKFRQGVRRSVAFLSVHSRSAALPSRPYNQKRHVISYRLNDWTNNDKQLRITRRPITLRNHIPKNYVFSWEGVRTPLTPLVWLRHCYYMLLVVVARSSSDDNVGYTCGFSTVSCCSMLMINLTHVGFWSCQYNIFFHIV